MNQKRKNKTSLAAKIYFWLGVLAAVMIGMCFINMELVSRQKETLNAFAEGQINDLQDVSTIIEELQEAQKCFYGYLQNKDKNQKNNFLEEYKTATENVISTFDAFGERVPEANQKEFFDFEDYVKEGIRDMDKIMELNDSGASNEMIQSEIADMQGTMDEIAENISNMSSDCKSRIQGSKDSVYSKFEISMVMSKVMLVIIAILSVIVFFRIEISVIKLLRKQTKKLNGIVSGIEAGEGNLKERLVVTSSDEVGQISQGINLFLDILQRVMNNIKTGADTLQNSADEIVNRVNEADDATTNISATMEEMSAGMQNVTSNISDITSGIEKADQEIHNMQQQTVKGLDLAKEIKDKAVTLSDNAAESQKNTAKMVFEITEELEHAIAESRKVSKINELTDNILSIASQTNLLALNASIEAARAGEAGRGFSVVADEIRILANGSKSAADDIQKVSELVTKSVNELAENATKMLEYIHQVILADYDVMVNTGASYHEDANNFESMMQDLQTSALEIKSKMDQMVDATTNVMTVMEECAEGTENIANSSTELVSGMGEIVEHIDENNNIVTRLQKELARFKYL